MELQTNETILKSDDKLWTKNFLFLWQGQLVSSIGDIFFQLSLGFWILAVTGSTILMGTVLATFMLPNVVISPFAGVLADRVSKKRLMILMDSIRGASIVLLGLFALKGDINVVAVFIAVFILGACGAFFTPSINSTIPSIVPKSKLVNANSAFGMITGLSNILGNSTAGFLYALIGIPYMLLLNGVSFIFSAFTISVLKMPPVKAEKRTAFFSEMKEGLLFTWGIRGLRYLIIISSIVNFIGNIAIIQFMPLFYKTEGLGTWKYGLAMAVFTCGMILGTMVTYSIKIPYSKKSSVFLMAVIVYPICLALFPIFKSFIFMLAMMFVGGAFMSIGTVFINSTIQLTVPQKNIGKVFGLMGALTQGLTPLAMILGGVLAAIIPYKNIISICYILIAVLSVGISLIPSFRHFLNFDPEKNTINEIR